MMSNTLIIAIVATVFSVITLVLAIRNEIRLRKLFRGKGAKDLESVIQEIMEEIKKIHENEDMMASHIHDSSRKLKKSIRGFETIRFNPFKDQGGNQSFAIAFLNDEGDGVVISSLYSRDRTSVFAKPIKKMASEFELTEEEKEALNKAIPK